MLRKIRIVLFSEINSKLGSPFLRILSAHPGVDLLAVLSSPEGRECSYFSHDATVVNLATEASALGVPITRPKSVNDAATVSYLESLRPDYIIVGNFQQKINKSVLEVPRKSVLNFHPSPLPRYAGLAPFYWLVRNGERESAISVIEMDEGLDTGPIVMQRSVYISNIDTALSLRTRQEQENVLMLLELIPRLIDDRLQSTPQVLDNRTYFGRPAASDYQINPFDTAETIQNQVRAAYRNPGATLRTDHGGDITILSVARTQSSSLSSPFSSGTIIHLDGNVYLAAQDEWLRILTVEVGKQEVRASPGNIESTYTVDLDANATVPVHRRNSSISSNEHARRG